MTTMQLLRRISDNLGAYVREPSDTTREELAEQLRKLAVLRADAADLLSCVEQLSSSSLLAVRRAAFVRLKDLYDEWESHRDGAPVGGRTAACVRYSLPQLAAYRVLSESSSSTRTRHECVAVTVADFPLVGDIGEPRGVPNLLWIDYTTKGGEDGVRSTERSIADLVSMALTDMLYECGLARTLGIVGEMGTFELRPDVWIIRRGRLPVGVVAVKQPGVGVLDDERVLGELFDYMNHLPNFYGTRPVIGILTTYREWRVCWLDNDETVRLVGETETIASAKTETIANPVILDQVPTSKKKDTSPPDHAPSKKRTDHHSHEERAEAKASRKDRQKIAREMFASRVWSIEEDNVFQLVASALLKMSRVTVAPFEHPCDKLNERALLRVGPTSMFWERLAADVKPAWNTPPSSQAMSFYLLQDLGTGSRGHVWLACSKGGAVCGLKFLRGLKGKPQRGDDVALQKEHDWWHLVYPEFGKYVRLVTLCGRQALLMPHFDTPTRGEDTLRLVEQCLRERFVARGLKHGDVRWRNVGMHVVLRGVLPCTLFARNRSSKTRIFSWRRRNEQTQPRMERLGLQQFTPLK
jgi:hypothetical protein